MSSALLAAYREAEYVVLHPRVVIRIGALNRALDELLGDTASAAFITAANPRSERLSDTENLRLVNALKQRLAATRHRFCEGEGRDPKGEWPPEPSLLVLGIGRVEATALARRFAQNGFVWCERGRAPELVIVAKWRLVLDTHIWLDWLVFDDPSIAPLKAALAEDRIEIYLDGACEAELERVLAYPIGKNIPSKERQRERLDQARRFARRPEHTLGDAERASLPRCSDGDDQKFLELALAARAHALITKDRALLAVARRSPFRIVQPADATQLFERG